METPEPRKQSRRARRARKGASEPGALPRRAETVGTSDQGVLVRELRVGAFAWTHLSERSHDERARSVARILESLAEAYSRESVDLDRELAALDEIASCALRKVVAASSNGNGVPVSLLQRRNEILETTRDLIAQSLARHAVAEPWKSDPATWANGWAWWLVVQLAGSVTSPLRKDTIIATILPRVFANACRAAEITEGAVARAASAAAARVRAISPGRDPQLAAMGDLVATIEPRILKRIRRGIDANPEEAAEQIIMAGLWAAWPDVARLKPFDFLAKRTKARDAG